MRRKVLGRELTGARGLTAGVVVVVVATLLGACAEDDTATPTPARSAATSASTSKAATPAEIAKSTGTAAASGSPLTPAPATGVTTVRIGDTPLGKVLVDERGHTLYMFRNDPTNEGKSVCNGNCAAIWPYLPAPAAGSPTKPAEATAAITVIIRDDGSKQVAYAGHPLYRYAADTAPGETKGEGVGGVWSVARPEASQTTGAPGPGDPGY